MPSCCVLGCTGTEKPGRKSYLFPKVNHQTEAFEKLSIRRRDVWLTALGKTNTDPKSCERLQICDYHFISGKMAALQDVNNVDWIPTMNLRHTRISSDILRCSIDGCVVSNQDGLCRFYRIPKKTSCVELKQVSHIRLSAWISALGQCNDVPATSENIYVCHAHYIIDMSAKLRDTGLTVSSEISANDSEVTDNIMRTQSNKNSQSLESRLVSPKRVKSVTTKQKSDFFKSGDILRNENGQFSFSCSYCNAVNDDCRVMVNHIKTHFDKTKESKIPSPEFVNCSMTTDYEAVDTECSKTFRELTNSMPEPRPSNEGTKNYVRPDCSYSRPLKRLLPKPSIDELVASRPCKIERVKTVDTMDFTPTIKSSTLPVKFIPIRIPPLPVELAEKLYPSKDSRSPGWCFGKNYEIMYKDTSSSVEKKPTIKHENETVQLTSPKDLRKTSDKCNTVILKCSQCKLESGVDVSIPSPHKCKECEEWFPNHITYRTHFLATHRFETVKCYQCEMEPPITNESDPRRHKCAMCKDWFANHAEFKTHLKDDHDEYVTDNDFNSFANDYKEFNCYICEKTLKQRDYLVLHMKDHFEKCLEYQCHLCGLRSMRQESVLKEHMKRHHNNATQCDLCDKIFPNGLRMRAHRLCHTSELNYKCPICSKGFKLSKYLSRHMAVHNEVKIPCRYCDKTFKFSTGRRAHEKSVHNVL